MVPLDSLGKEPCLKSDLKQRMEIKVHNFRKGYNLVIGHGVKKPNINYKSVKKLLKVVKKC